MAFEGDWIFLRTALPDLQAYLLSSDLYWPLHPATRLPGGAQVPQLSIGSLLLSLARLDALALNESQEAECAKLRQAMAAVRAEWRANWGRKAEAEFHSRLNLWQQYLRELRAEVHPSSGFYGHEVRQRAMLHLLLPEMDRAAAPHEQEQLTMLDSILRASARPGEFVWEPELAAGFDSTEYWFLYMDVTR